MSLTIIPCKLFVSSVLLLLTSEMIDENALYSCKNCGTDIHTASKFAGVGYADVVMFLARIHLN